MSDINRRIAELRGWTEIRAIGDAWAGYPPEPPHILRILAFEDDWAETGPLLDELVDGSKKFGSIMMGRVGARQEIVYVDIPYGFSYVGHYAEGDTLQRAICEAWVAWREEQK